MSSCFTPQQPIRRSLTTAEGGATMMRGGSQTGVSLPHENRQSGRCVERRSEPAECRRRPKSRMLYWKRVWKASSRPGANFTRAFRINRSLKIWRLAANSSAPKFPSELGPAGPSQAMRTRRSLWSCSCLSLCILRREASGVLRLLAASRSGTFSAMPLFWPFQWLLVGNWPSALWLRTKS